MTTILEFNLDQPQNQTLSYRPWGVRTMKVRVTTDDGAEALRIRPKAIRQQDLDNKIIRAFADDDSDTFVITWGGGHEPGPCAKAADSHLPLEDCQSLESEDESFVYFNLQHLGPDVPDESTVTLQAFDEDGGDPKAAIEVKLVKPAGYPKQAVRFEVKDGVWKPRGNQLPQYDQRWWPGEFSYEAVDSLPLSIHVDEEDKQPTLIVQWNNKTVATIADYTEPSVLTEATMSFELFSFDQWHVALRCWFFWVDTSIAGSFEVGQFGRHEVPDAERFDFLIHTTDDRVSLGCTDLHWREEWGYTVPHEDAEKDILRATIGYSAQAILSLVKDKFADWAPWGKKDSDDHDEIFDPIEDVRRMARKWYGEKSLPVGTLRDQGSEAHIPRLENALKTEESPSFMISSDVRKG